MTETAMAIALEARELARQANRDIDKHEDICAERYAGIHKAVSEVKGIMWKVGGAGFSILIALLGFLALQMLNKNDQRADAQQARIEQLQQQLNDARSHKP